MYIDFLRVTLSEPVMAEITAIYDHIFRASDLGILIKRLSALKMRFENEIHEGWPAHIPPVKRYPLFTQYLMIHICDNHEKIAEAPSLCLSIAMTLGKNLFYCGDADGVLWTDPDGNSHLLTVVERLALKDSNFSALLQMLINKASEALSTAASNEDMVYLRHALLQMEFKRRLVDKLDAELAPYWGRFEHRLVAGWQEARKSLPESRIIASQDRLALSDELPFSPPEVDALACWLEHLRGLLEGLWGNFCDSVTLASIIDIARDEQDFSDEDPHVAFNGKRGGSRIYFMPDGAAYQDETIRQLVTAARPETPINPGEERKVYIHSPHSRRKMEAKAEESQSLLMLATLGRGLMRIKAEALILSRMSVNRALELAVETGRPRGRRVLAYAERCTETDPSHAHTDRRDTPRGAHEQRAHARVGDMRDGPHRHLRPPIPEDEPEARGEPQHGARAASGHSHSHATYPPHTPLDEGAATRRPPQHSRTTTGPLHPEEPLRPASHAAAREHAATATRPQAPHGGFFPSDERGVGSPPDRHNDNVGDPQARPLARS